MSEKREGLFEISWEVCNKVGGIYTVLSSKAPYVNNNSFDYTLIGPYFQNVRNIDFLEEAVPPELREPFNELRNEGILCRYGKWMIKSEPSVILVDFSSLFSIKNELKAKLWEDYKIDSLGAGFDFEEPVLFSIAAARVVDKIHKRKPVKTIAHFHEWMTGAGLLWLKKNNPKISTVFTTHATVLGRAIAGASSDFYSFIDKVDVDKEAHERGVLAKHLTEKASAQNADIFTTVSEITGYEAGYLLGKKADFILPNGIDLQNFASFEELSIRHSELKHSIKDFVISYFFPYYSFDLDETLLFFTIGRYEFANKGIDVMIDSLGKLNEQMKKEKSDKTIVSFFFVPADYTGINHEILDSKTLFADMESFIEGYKEEMKNRVVHMTASKTKITQQNLFSDTFSSGLKKKAMRFSRGSGNAPYSTHDLRYFNEDSIIKAFRKVGLNNSSEDKVKVVFYPSYVRAADSLLNLEIYEAILGEHLGIFPSAYEPWGYTPLESAALGVASVTSDLSGFGKYVEKELNKSKPGVFVLKRFGKTYSEVVAELYKIVYDYTKLDKEGRIQNKIEARRIAALADWKNFVKNYFAVYESALKKN